MAEGDLNQFVDTSYSARLTMEDKKRVILIISVITMIVGLFSMFYFEAELDKMGTYESMNLLYMLASQAVCGAGLLGLLIGLRLKNPMPNGSSG